MEFHVARLRITVFVALCVAAGPAYPQQRDSARAQGTFPAVDSASVQFGGEPRAALVPLRGTVLAEDTRMPVRRARIDLSAFGTAADPVFTDERGRFDLLIPAASPYTIAVTKPGFARQELTHRVPPQDPVTVRLPRGAAVTGRVVDDFGDPVFARVRLTGPEGERTIETDPLGEFRLGSLAAGRYSVSVAALGQPMAVEAQQGATVDLAAGDEADLLLRGDGPRFGPPVAYDAAQRGNPLGTGVIRGTIIGPTGLPVGGAAVSLGFNGSGAGSAITDASGRYEFTALPRGVFGIGVTKFNPRLIANAATRVSLRDGQVLDDVTIVLPRPGSLAGVVRDEYGEPVEGVIVELWKRQMGAGRTVPVPVGSPMTRARTDDRGRYRLLAVAGPSFVVASAAPSTTSHTHGATHDGSRTYYPGTTSIGDAVTVEGRAGVDLDAIDIRYATHVPGRIRGFAVDADGRPLTEPVRLTESHRAGAAVQAARTAAVGPDGLFGFTNVPGGEYVLQAMVRGAGGQASEVAVAYTTVGDGEAAPVVLRTTPGTTLSGRIVLEGETAASLQQFHLFAQTADWDYLPLGREPPRAIVEDDGSFFMPGLYGPLHVTASPPPGWWLKAVNIGVVDAAQQPFAFGGVPTIENVTVTFADTAADISGRVRDRDRNQPATTYSVLVFSTDRTRWWAPSAYVRLAQPDAQGQFHALSLAPGDYFVIAVDRFDINAEWLDPDLLAELEPLARRVTLRERGRAAIELDLVRRVP